ncbi:YncE family protein [Plebeiibacterium sediminum]|uniref:YncE family protein n=1 Tax=Plebeiibacterium sediminum TaxID=2992112 RepID=A0AAE3M4C4_9BACT|nr:YncE family protein [Plebeiobacterium sediminum]MCW3786904.1 YncE family protein [Plebeiobacterium sediminum]
MRKIAKLAFYALIFSLLVVSCTDDEENYGLYGKGVYVLNEGSASGSVSYINTDNDDVTNGIFALNNGVPLGQYPQSMAFSKDYLVIVVTTSNGAGSIEIVDKETMLSVAAFTELSYPREVTIYDNKAYVTNGSGEGVVYVVDLKTLTMNSTSIAVGHGPEKMVVSNDKLYVANSGGWLNDDNTVSVINLNTLTVENTITVKACPKDMVVDADGNVWVNCGGAPDYSNYPNVSYTDAGLSKINTEDNSVTSWPIANPSGTVKNMAVSPDGSTIYFVSDAVYAMEVSSSTLPSAKFIDDTFYGIDVNPDNGDVWVCDQLSYSDPSVVKCYSKEGAFKAEYTVGVSPNSCMFW